MYSITNGDIFDEFADDIAELQDDVTDAIDRAVETTAEQVERSAKQTVPVDTGNLRASIRTLQIASGTYQVGSNVDYADDVEYGTAPHVITPDDADALKFEGSDGQTVFAVRVEHPGTSAQPYLRPAVAEHRSDLAANIEAEIERLADRQF